MAKPYRVRGSEEPLGQSLALLEVALWDEQVAGLYWRPKDEI